MFGYVRSELNYMYVKDVRLYKALYCGLCKGIGGTCGQCGRLALNYDLTFLTAFCHNVLGVDVKVERRRCIMHWLRRRDIARRDFLTDRIACLNLILAYHKICDDVNDANRGRAKRAFFRASYRRAAKKEPKLDSIVAEKYAALLNYERGGGGSVDIAADFFASMLRELAREILADKFCEAAGDLSYNLGKWIYLIDALDDYDKDIKKKQFNPFRLTYGNAADRKELMEKHGEDVRFVFGTVLGNIAENAKKIKYEFNHDLTDNILFRGLSAVTLRVIEGDKRRYYAGKL